MARRTRAPYGRVVHAGYFGVALATDASSRGQGVTVAQIDGECARVLSSWAGPSSLPAASRVVVAADGEVLGERVSGGYPSRDRAGSRSSDGHRGLGRSRGLAGRSVSAVALPTAHQRAGSCCRSHCAALDRAVPRSAGAPRAALLRLRRRRRCAVQGPQFLAIAPRSAPPHQRASSRFRHHSTSPLASIRLQSGGLPESPVTENKARVARREKRVQFSTVQLIAHAVTESTRKKYERAVAEFVTWADERGLEPETAEDTDDCLVAWCQELFEDGGSRQMAANALFGLQSLRPRLRKQLITARLALVGWAKLEPKNSWPPITWPLVCAIAVT